jgi:RNA polymerase sigma-70 factor (ECF subfamily)
VTSSDRELLAQSVLGNRGAFGEFVARHEAPLWRFARALAHDEAEAEDVLQQTFVAAWRAAGELERDDGRAWLFAIARREAAQLARRRGARHERERSLEELGECAGFGDPGATPEQVSARLEEEGLLERALARLAPREREILVLRELEGLSGAEAAQLLGLSAPAEKARLHRARLALASELRTLTHGAMS